MLFALLAIIGATIDAGAGYWIVYGCWCFFKVIAFGMDCYKRGLER